MLKKKRNAWRTIKFNFEGKYLQDVKQLERKRKVDVFNFCYEFKPGKFLFLFENLRTSQKRAKFPRQGKFKFRKFMEVHLAQVSHKRCITECGFEVG